ncbi:ABC transporter substrate-binding protein [Heliorestis convoluta]|uniref:Branched-chain amino acid abc transporter substrate-binding protein n=1 Tax=Heliorestis convoluta TaxID=356322 RepID=A0A5Q2N415_9FIRM|nr:ABC transporter substrate-binding protein [Heliorestis convoluta]QGG47010.1 branched-chain amino acid abc transporter substrate-binding protein [Heliorestis convoluta]
MIFLTRKTLLLILALLFIVPIGFYVGYQKISSLKEPQPAATPIQLGVALELSGQISPWGQAAFKGLQMAIDEVNDQGGIKGRYIQTHTADASDAEGLSVFAREAVNRNLVAIIGPMTPSKAELLAQKNLSLPLFSLSTHPSTPTFGDNIYQGSYDDRQQGSAAAHFASSYWGERAVMVVEEKSAYGQALAQSFRQTYEKAGGTIVNTLYYQRDQQDFSTLLSNILNGQPQVIYLPGYAKESAAFLQQARQVGIALPILGGDSLEEMARSLLQESRNQVRWGLFYITPNFLPTEEGKTFEKAYKARYHEEPHPIALWAYDATKGLLKALSECKDPEDQQALAERIKQMEPWPVAGGTMKIGQERHALRPMAVMQVGPTLELVAVIDP